MEHAAAGTATTTTAAATIVNVGGAEERLPEARLNGVILRWAFIDKAISGFGALALAWATIVLLGGFSTLIKQKDFLFVTIITFLEATRLFSSAVDPADQFIINAPEVVAAATERAEAMEQGSWIRRRNEVQGTITAPRQGLGRMLASHYSKRCTCRVFFGKTLSMGFTFAQFAANITSFILAVLRLCKQDYVEPADQGSSDHKSIKVSLNLFYGLVLVQGISNFLADTMLAADVQQVLKLSMTYQLGHSGVLIIKRYMLVTYMKCFSGRVREAMNMDLVSFAMEMVRSDSVADRLIGVRVLDRILRVNKYRELVLMRLRASAGTIGTMVNMLGLKNNTQKEENTRGHAANVVLELSPDLLVASFPAMLQLITSLITVKTVSSRNHQQYSSNMELTWFGVKILNKIMDNPENCKNVADADDQMISIMYWIARRLRENKSFLPRTPEHHAKKRSWIVTTRRVTQRK